ncbi:MAG TPA: maleylpyruvate isomerase N-terminal domain-containing protein [Mycobacterium sp.]|nr:maleylpyruvate isomerase N-terminal domain-containing protein [Mycobacterium sp.]
MKTVPATPAGPIDDVRRADARASSALAAAIVRSAQLWRSIADSSAPVPGLAWTAGQTAAHVVADMGEYTEVLTRHVNGETAEFNIPDGSPARARNSANDRHLVDVPERDMRRLADLLEAAAAKYLAAASAIDTSERVALLTADGLVLEPAVMTCLLLGEQLVHGLDIARAARRPWNIERDDALLAIPAALSLVPKYLRPRTTNASFELRLRGAPRYRVAIANGTGVVTVAGEKADCVITADPVTFLLLGLNRVPQLPQLLRGKLRAGGRRPWLAAKFGTLLESP